MVRGGEEEKKGRSPEMTRRTSADFFTQQEGDPPEADWEQ